MFIKRLLFLFFGLMVFSTVTVPAQADRSKVIGSDIVGTWMPLSPDTVSAEKLTVVKDGLEYRVTRVTGNAGNGGNSETSIYFADGRGEENSFDVTLIPQIRSSGTKLKTSTRSKNGKLFTSGSISKLTQPFGHDVNTYYVSQELSLTNNGETLIWKTIIDGPQAAFVRHDPNNAVSNTSGEGSIGNSYIAKSREVVRIYRRIH